MLPRLRNRRHEWWIEGGLLGAREPNGVIAPNDTTQEAVYIDLDTPSTTGGGMSQIRCGCNMKRFIFLVALLAFAIQCDCRQPIVFLVRYERFHRHAKPSASEHDPCESWNEHRREPVDDERGSLYSSNYPNEFRSTECKMVRCRR